MHLFCLHLLQEENDYADNYFDNGEDEDYGDDGGDEGGGKHILGDLPLLLMPNLCSQVLMIEYRLRQRELCFLILSHIPLSLHVTAPILANTRTRIMGDSAKQLLDYLSLDSRMIKTPNSVAVKPKLH